MKVIRLYKKYDKTRLAQLPRVLFDGRIFVIQSESEAQKAVDYLLTQKLLGFDTETRPTFRPGPMNQVALLQVATEDTCFLFRLNRMGLTPSLVRLLSAKGVKKVALSWRDDTNQLKRLGEVDMEGFIELQSYVTSFGIEDQSLQKLYANVFEQRISKAQQLTNWEADALTEAQKLYAATDAWACLMLYQRFEEIKKDNNWELIEDEESISK